MDDKIKIVKMNRYNCSKGGEKKKGRQASFSLSSMSAS